MGRMADARKRAQQKKGGEGAGPNEPTPPPASPPSEPDRPATRESFAEEEVATPPESAPRWVSREEPLTFPAEKPTREAAPAHDDARAHERMRQAAPKGRLALPSSGLASDILANAGAALPVEAMPEAALAMLPASPTPEPAVPFQNVSFFGPQSRDERKVIVEPMEHLVTFFLADEEYGLDVRVVQEIIRVVEVTHVPRAPEFIKGVINLRGRIIPVVDLKRKLDLGDVVPSRLSRIVVVKLRDRLIGLLADGASQVLKIPVSSIDAAPEEILDVSVSFIRGVAKLEKRLIILLDLQKILAAEIDHAAAP